MQIRAFTLIELLVVILIITLLGGLIIAALGSADTRGQIAKTEQCMQTVAQATHLFVDETGFTPLPSGSSEQPLASGHPHGWYPSGAEAWSDQRLFWRLGKAMTESDHQAAAQADDSARQAVDPLAKDENRLFQICWTAGGAEFRMADARRLQIIIDGLPVTNAEAAVYRQPPASWTHTSGELPDFEEVDGNSAGRIRIRALVKIERTKQMGILAGRWAGRAFSTAQLLGQEDIASGMRDGDCILDAWGQPLGFISTNDPGVKGRTIATSAAHDYTSYIGTPASGRALLTDRNGDGDIDLDDLAEEATDAVDSNGDGSVDAADWGSLLWYDTPDFHRGFIVLSHGPDRAGHVIFHDSSNADNLLIREAVK